MTKKTQFNRLDKIKDPVAKMELARAHTMIALLGVISIALISALHVANPDLNTILVIAVIALLALIVIFSTGVSISLRTTRRK